MSVRAALVLVLAAVWTLAPAAESGPGDPFGQLMTLLAQRTHGVADFHEQQYLALLRHPLESSGTLLYDAPDHLEQRTLAPRAQSVVIDHGQMSFELGTHRRTVALADYPQIAPLIDSLRATLAGDRAALERGFQLQFEGDLAHWSLLLTPRDPQLAQTVQSIRLAGEGAAILEVQLLQANGDHALMRITPRE